MTTDATPIKRRKFEALNDAQLRAWMRAGEAIVRTDGRGLTFTLSRAGTAAWTLRYRFGGRVREVTLGRYPDMGLALARTEAAKLRLEIAKGTDVAAAKQEAKKELSRRWTFERLFDDFLQKRSGDYRPNTLDEFKRHAVKDILPRIGSMHADAITPADVCTMIEEVAERSKSVARRLFEILSVAFDHGVPRRLPTNPCRVLNVSSIVGTQQRRERVKLTLDELRAALAALPGLGRDNELAVRVLLATAVRKGELIRARWSEVDIDAGLWRITDENSKTGAGFVVPLSPIVADWFRELRELADGSPWVLPSRNASYRGRRRGEDHIGETTLNAALVRLGAKDVRDFSPHDLRATARSYLTDELGVDVIVAERCLNHALGGLVGVYDKSDYLTHRRAALALWAQFIADAEQPRAANVLPLVRPGR